MWNKEQFGDSLKRVQRIEADLSRLEDASSSRQLSSHEMMTRKKLGAMVGGTISRILDETKGKDKVD